VNLRDGCYPHTEERRILRVRHTVEIRRMDCAEAIAETLKEVTG
jgi:hypothetical protein